MQQVTIYTDGACKGNPGPGGWGAVLSTSINNQIKRKNLSGAEDDTTNNRMELTAVIKALAALKKPCQVNLYLDSQYVRQGITQWLASWKTNNWKTANNKPVKNADLWQQLDALVNANQYQHSISWHWVKGHSGIHGNELADTLATQATEQLIASRN